TGDRRSRVTVGHTVPGRPPHGSPIATSSRVGEGPGYRTPPPSSNRTCGFPASGLPENLRGTVIRLATSPIPDTCGPVEALYAKAYTCGSKLHESRHSARPWRPRQGPFAPPELPGFGATT